MSNLVSENHRQGQPVGLAYPHPLSATSLDRHTGWISFSILAVFYLATSAPGIGWFDSAEWALVIKEWGLGHPPGSPGYIVLAGVFDWMSPLSTPRSLVLFSGFFGAMSAFPMDALLRRFGVSTPLARVAWVLLGGTLPSIWLQAVRIELYSLSTFLFLLVVSWSLKAKIHYGVRGIFLRTGLVLGFLGTVNPMFALAAGTFLGGRFCLEQWAKKFDWQSFGQLVMGMTIGLIPFIYCILVPKNDGRFVWGDWETFDDLVFYFSGRDYLLNWAGEVNRLGNLEQLLAHLFLEGALPLLLLGLGFGILFWLRRYDRTLARDWFILLFVGLVLLYFVISNRIFFAEVPDYHGYLGPLVWTLVMGAASVLRGNRTKDWFVYSVLALLACCSLKSPVWARTLVDQSLPRRLAQSILEELPPNAIYLGSSDHIVFPLMYLQSEGQRTDVVVVNLGFTNSAWFWRRLRQLHSTLVVPDVNTPMPRAERVRSLLAYNTQRAVYFESSADARALRLPTCLDSHGLRASAICDKSEFQNTIERLNGFWAQTAESLVFSPKVIAKFAEDAAIDQLQRGFYRAGLELLRFGINPESRPKACDVGSNRSRLKAPQLEPVLIGDPRRNLIHFRALCLSLTSGDQP